MTFNVMKLLFNDKWYICIKDTNKKNPFILYERWYDRGWHRKKLAAYADMDSVLFHVMQIKYPCIQWDVRESN